MKLLYEKEDCDFSFDQKLNKIDKMNWFPWIGKNYIKTGFLIVGDSHYEDGEGWLSENRKATRQFINNNGKHSYFSSPLLRNIAKTIYNKEIISEKENHDLWINVAYFNLCQRLLPEREGGPKEEDYDLGWSVFFKIIEIIKPKYILKCGINGDGRLGNMMANNNPGWKFISDEFFEKPRIINLSKNNYKTKIVFINHPSGSRGYNCEEWHNVIIDKGKFKLPVKIK